MIIFMIIVLILFGVLIFMTMCSQPLKVTNDVVIEKIYGIDVVVPKANLTDNNVIYVDGIKDVVGGSKMTLTIQNNFLLLQRGISNIKKINKSNLINAEIMSEHQIIKQVTLGRFLCFGIFSLGMPKQKEIYTNYLVLTYDNEGENRQIVLRPSHSLEKTVQILNKFISE